MAFTYLKVKFAKCLCKIPMVGLVSSGLGLVILVLVLVVRIWSLNQSGQTIKLFQAPRKNSFTFHFGHKSFILDDVKLAELSNNSFK